MQSTVSYTTHLSKRWRTALAGICTGVLMCGCHPPTLPNGKAGPKGPVNPRPGVVLRRSLNYFYDRSQLISMPDTALQQALAKAPPAVEMRMPTDPSVPFKLEPILPTPKVERTVKVDIAILGGEIESITTAIAAADAGYHVALVYDCPLGGLLSDQSGNLRYFDGVQRIPRPPSQKRLFHVVGIKEDVAIPPGVSERIDKFLREAYAKSIELVPVQSLSVLDVHKKKRITAIVGDDGTKVIANSYLDTDPESRPAELAGIPYSTETAPLSYGQVFDVLGPVRPLLNAFANRNQLFPEAIRRWQGVTTEEGRSTEALQTSEARLNLFLTRDTYHVYRNCSYGYEVLAEAYNYAMLCKAVKDNSPNLQWLNERRVTSGFNIAFDKGWLNFNGLSYQLQEMVPQHCHDLDDVFWSEKMERERSELQGYFEYLCPKQSFLVRLPRELYVRRATATFQTLHPYWDPDFNDNPTAKWWMEYHLDLRDAEPVDLYDLQLLRWMNKLQPRFRRWNCRGSATATVIPNLFILNKSTMPMKYFGCLRIQQNLINTGQDWVETLEELNPLDPKAAKQLPARSATQAKALALLLAHRRAVTRNTSIAPKESLSDRSFFRSDLR